MNTTVLLVDDEEAVLKGYRRNIGDMFEIETAPNAQEALIKLQEADKYALIVSDYRMPGLTGIEFLRKARELRPDTVRMLITGYADLQISLDAINEGSVFRMLTKPCSTQNFYKAIEDGLRQHELITSEHELFEKTLNGSVQALGDILSVLDPAAFGRSNRLRVAAREVARAMGMKDIWEIEIAATLSEVGRITLPSVVSRKQIGLSVTSEEEKALLTRLPEFSAKIVSHIPRLQEVANIILYQAKNFDGSGFPVDKLRGEYIHRGARLLRILNEVLLRVEKGKTPLDAITEISTDDNHFDITIFKHVVATLPLTESFLAKPKLTTAGKILVPLSELQEGYLLLSDIETKDGVLIINAGHIISGAVLQRIHNFAAIMPIKEPIAVTPYTG